MSGNDTFDAIVIGAGHNGMACAFYLARARRRVLVVEAADAVGGAARPVAFGELEIPYAAHLDYGMSRRVIADMELERHGLAWAEHDIGATAFGVDDRRIDFALSRGEAPAGADAVDAAAWATFRARMSRFASIIDDIAHRSPPRLAGSGADARAWLAIAWRLRRLGREDMREFLRIGAINLFDVLEEHFDDPLLKGALAAESLIGHGLAPRSPNSVLTFLARLASGGAVAMPRGGMTALARAMESACRTRQVAFRLGTGVRRILVDSDRAAGVELENGEVIEATDVVSSADAWTTGVNLLGTAHLDTGTVRRLRHIRGRGCTARIDLLLDDVDGLDRELLGRRLLFAGDMDRLERAFNHGKYNEVSPEPLVEFIVPTVIDPTQMTGKRHLASALVQYVPRDAGDDDVPTRTLKAAREVIERALPGLFDRVRETRVTLPVDVERDTGIHGGHWHHAEIALDQFFMLRPAPTVSRYAMPLPGVWLCGASAHPGGGITGLPGYHAAARIIAPGANP